jgi:hypothetical protein
MKPADSDGMLLTSALDRAAGRLLRNKDVFIIKQERTQGKEVGPQKKAGNGEFDMIGRPGCPVAARLFDTVEKRLRRAGRLMRVHVTPCTWLRAFHQVLVAGT